MTKVSATIMKFPEKSFHHPETGSKYVASNLPKGGPAWLQALRRAALNNFHKQGIPTSKLERWKYMNLAPRVKDFSAELAQADMKLSGETAFAQTLENALEKNWVREVLEMPPAGDDRHHDMALWYLSQTYARDGIVVDVPAGKKIAKPLEITITGQDKQFTNSFFVFRVQDDAEFTVTETLSGEGRYWNNALAHIHVGKNATFRHYRIENNSNDSVYTQNTFVTVEEGGVYEAFVLTNGAKTSRNQVHAMIKGSNAACNLFGLNLLNGQQHADSTFLIEHQAPNCTSDQSIRSLIGDEAQGVFQGKIHVHREGQKTDGYQLSNTMLLSDKASMNTKPELEIYADDVKCSHGATTGQLDEEPMFYLRSRGLNEAEARFLMVNAFTGELLDKISDEGYREYVRGLVETWLRNAL